MSDFEIQRKLRMEAMQDKKKRLEELKKMRQDRVELPENSVQQVESSFSQLNVNETNTNKSIDNLLNSILKPVDIPEASPIVEIPKQVEPVFDHAKILEDKRNKLETCSRNIMVSIAPAVVETYDKSIQTDEVVEIHDEFNVDLPSNRNRSRSNSLSKRTMASPLKPMLSSSTEHQVHSEVKSKPVELVVDNVQLNTFLSKSSKYIERALVQGSNYDILVDYKADNVDAVNDSKNINSSVISMSAIWSLGGSDFNNRPVLSIESCSKYKELFIISYGAKQSKKTAVNNNAIMNGAMDKESDNGVVCIWSNITSKAPEIIGYSSTSPILISKFHPHYPKLFVCGCYNGQILLFDMNAEPVEMNHMKYVLPIQRSLIAYKTCHKYPIVNFTFMEYATSDNSNKIELISVSSDYQCCHWDLTSLNEPLKSYSLTATNRGLNTSLNLTEDRSRISSISFAPISMNIANEQFMHVYVSNNEGKVYHHTIPPQYGNGVQNHLHADAHFGMVTAMQLHTNSLTNKKLNQLSNLLLTVSFDWTIKLWDGEHFIPPVGTNATGIGSASNTIAATVPAGLTDKERGPIRPILEWMITSFDYICDIQWSPTHPGLFAAITSNNKLYLYNLLLSTTVPADVITLQDMNITTSVSQAAGTKIIWNSNGKVIYIGNSTGVVTSIQLSDTIVAYNNQDDMKLIQIIQHLKK